MLSTSSVASYRASRNAEIDASNLLLEQTSVHLVPGISGAFALHKSLGLVTAIDYSYSTPTASVPTQQLSKLQFGAALDFDLNAITPVPVGFQASYLLVVPVGGGDQNFGSNTVDLGIFYTGRIHLSVGPELRYSAFTLLVVPDNLLPNLNLTRNTSANLAEALLVLRYYF